MKLTYTGYIGYLLTGMLATSWVGCNTDTADANSEVKAVKGVKTDKGSKGSPDAGEMPPPKPDPVYGIGSLTFSDTGSNDYLLLVPSLELSGKQITLEEAREFPGNSDLAVYEGTILASSGDAPSITKFEVGEDRSLHAKETVSFSEFGLLSAAFWNNQFVTENKAYMVNGSSELIIWNPKDMTLNGTINLPQQESREGLHLVAALADRSSVVHDGKFYLPMYWTDADYAQRSADSVLVVVDVATDTVIKTISAGCPGLDYGTLDDDGKLHFSNWTGGVGTYYVLGTAQNCIATLDPVTERVTTKTFASITGGHEGAAFKYAGNGRFVLSVFDEKRAKIDEAEDPFIPVGGTNWKLWSYDPKSGNAAPIEAVDWNSGAIIHSSIGGRMYSLVPGADYKSTVAYALGGPGGAEAAFGITGWSFRLFSVR